MSKRTYRLERLPDGSAVVTVVPEAGRRPYDLWAAHVRRRGAKHSPTGFEWGYSGSGPAELARAIMSDFLGREANPAEYQRFKAEIIAWVPYLGGELCLTTTEVSPGYSYLFKQPAPVWG
jgi:hypothetical protein